MAWPDLARAQAGVITHHQLVALGLPPDRIDRLRDSGALERRGRGVYLARGAPWTYRAQLWAAVLATDGVLGFGTASHLWGAIDTPPARIEVVVPTSRRVAVPVGVKVHRVFTPRSALVSREGLPITSRAQSLLDHLGRLPATDAVRLADRAFQRKWLATTDLERRLRELPGRQGNARLREIARRCGDGAAAESERLLHRILRRAGVRGWSPNHPVWHDGELVAVVDVALPAQRIAIEVDGWAYHSDVERFQRDRSRQNDLVALGWRVLRFTWADLTRRPGYVIAAIRRQVALAG